MRRPKSQRIEIAKRFDQITDTLGIRTSDMLVSSGISLSKEYRCGGDHSISGTLCDKDVVKICNTYKISYEWLIEGTGQMFVSGDAPSVQHCYNVFIKEENGTFRYYGTYDSIDETKIHLYVIGLNDPEKRKRTIVIETDTPITIYRKISV